MNAELYHCAARISRQSGQESNLSIFDDEYSSTLIALETLATNEGLDFEYAQSCQDNVIEACAKDDEGQIVWFVNVHIYR